MDYGQRATEGLFPSKATKCSQGRHMALSYYTIVSKTAVIPSVDLSLIW